MSIRPALLAALVSTLALAAPSSQASLVVYTTQASFLAAVSNPGTDNFQSLSISGTTASPMNRVAGTYSYTASAANTFFGAGTNADHWLSTNTATDAIVLNNFSSGVAGIGGFFFGSNIGGAFVANQSLKITAVDGNDTEIQTILGSSITSFLGFVSDTSWTSLSIQAIQPNGSFIWPTVNDLILAGPAPSVVPEPATLSLLGLGACGLLLRRRQR